MKTRIIQVILLIVIGFLAYQVWETIQTPVRFEKAKDFRTEIVVQRLKDIRSIQQMYRSLNDTFAPSIDVMMQFLKEAQIPVVNIVYDPTDTLLVKTINDTIGYKPVVDSLFGNRPNFKIDEFIYIPFSDGKIFEMGATQIDRGGVRVPVFMATAKKEYYLNGLDENMIKDKDVKDLIVGSLEEPSLDGNWE
ncbi:MAG: hypothetical protein EOM06_08285 [Sphingobacteriia bacterium]|nr:hypothetical protein [Sphingobacteriia bacterium]